MASDYISLAIFRVCNTHLTDFSFGFQKGGNKKCAEN
jgi:hypothetical protein